jgi:hypothetical protein
MAAQKALLTNDKAFLYSYIRMIINTGARTDIPAFYSTWFMNRIREGYVLVRNPYYKEQITRYRLTPDVVDCLLFCTKNPEPMLSWLPGSCGVPAEDREAAVKLAALRQYWFVTITPYGTDTEPYVPATEDVILSFQKLSQALELLHETDPGRHPVSGKMSVGWRYDPVFISKTYPVDFHIQAFRMMAGKLAGFTTRCVISFIDLYEKTKRNFPECRPVSADEQKILAQAFGTAAEEYGMTIQTCAENTDLSQYGIIRAGCITEDLFRTVAGTNTARIPSGKPNRQACRCIPSRDIGAYNTCPHGCRYCYANYDRQTVMRNYALHDARSPLLTGWPEQDAVIKDAGQVSWITDISGIPGTVQMELDFLKSTD